MRRFNRPACRLVSCGQKLQRKYTKLALSKDDIDYIAHLARLEIGAEEVPDYSAKLSKIIDFIAELDKSATGDLVPMAHPLDMSQRLRVDEVTATDQRDLYQENATEKSNGLYVVPRVVE